MAGSARPSTSIEAFRNLDLEDDDVVMATYQKCGTSWTHNLLFCLLRTDKDGNWPASPEELAKAQLNLQDSHFIPGPNVIGYRAQLYPDSLPLKRPEKPGSNGLICFEDLVAQRRPRLFSCHLEAKNLPSSLLGGRGKLVVCCRNPKDALISGYYMMKTRLENGAGPTADDRQLLENFYKVFNDEAQRGPYGGTYNNYYSWHRDMLPLVERLERDGRGFLTFYERLRSPEFDRELERLASFLGLPVPLSDAKLRSIASRASFEAMADRKVATIRKGVVGDHLEHLTPAHWSEMDRIFNERLGSLSQLRPLHSYTGMAAGAAKL